MGKEDIAAKLRQARLTAKKTQKEVADMLGMTYQAISNYERGRTKVESDILIKLCSIYGISVPEVLSNDPIKVTPQSFSSKDNDPRLQTIITCYNEMSVTGKKALAEQAEFLKSKHPKNKAKEESG